MSLVKTDRITNLDNDGQVEAIKGLKISTGKVLTILGPLDTSGDGIGVGTSGQYLTSTGTGLQWAGLPQQISTTSDVTFRDITASRDVVINGSLRVNGTSIGLSNLGVGSNEIRLNNDVVGPPTDDANIIVNRGDEDDTVLKWSEASQRWQFTNDGTTYYNMLLPVETDFGVAEQFGASGDGDEYEVSSSSYQVDGSNTYLKVVLQNRLDISNFAANHYVKIFGASLTPLQDLPSAPVIGSQTITASFESVLFNDGETPHSFYAYAFAHYTLDNGDVSEFVVYPDVVENLSSNEINEANYNVLNLTRVRGNGILVYRAEFSGADAEVSAQNAITNIGTDQTPFKLIAVLGPKEFTSDTLNANWQDYCEYDVTSWTNRNSKGEYSSNTVHMPVNPPSDSKRGWATGAIRNINGGEGSFWIDIPGLQGDLNNDISIVHDDTVPIQTAIDAAASSGKNFLIMPGGLYLIDTIELLNGFTLRGLADATIFKKQYWTTTNISSVERSGLRNAMFISKTYNFENASSTWTLNNFTLGDITLDGNATGEILYDFSDLGLETNNALIGLPNSEFVKLQNVKIRNSSGPALFAEGSVNFSIENCNFINGAETERYETDCVLMTDCENTKVNASVFQNYPGALDFTTGKVLAINGCIVRNCGSGIKIYGSVNTSVLNNLILGPSDEYIAVPDLYDSDYDGVNISVKYGVDNETPVYQYIESGVGKDLSDVTLRFNVYEATVSGGTETVDFASPILTGAGGDVFTYVNPVDSNLDPVDDITIGQIRFRMPAANSTLISAPTQNTYNVYQATGIEYKDIGNDINNVLGTGTYSSGEYTVVVSNAATFDAVAVDDYIKLVAHSFSPSSNVDVWRIKEKQAGAQNKLVLLPYLEESSSGNLTATTITGVGATPTKGTGYIQLRERFLIAKGVFSVVS